MILTPSYPLLAPAAYFSIQFYIEPERKVKRWEYSLYFTFIIGIIHQCITTYRYFVGTLGEYGSNEYWIHFYIVNTLQFINGIIFLIIFIFLIRQIKKYENVLQEHFSNLSDKSLNWVVRTVSAGLLLSVFMMVTVYFNLNKSFLFYFDERIIWLGITGIIYWIGYGLILRPELFTNLNRLNIRSEDQLFTEHENGPDKTSKLSKNTDKYHQKLLYLMNEKCLFRDPDFSMEQLAEEMNLSKSYLSKIIKTKERRNFFEFVNYYRVEDIKQKLKDTNFAHYSIAAIAMEAGFKSQSTFYSVFKKITGMTPSQFKQKI